MILYLAVSEEDNSVRAIFSAPEKAYHFIKNRRHRTRYKVWQLVEMDYEITGAIDSKEAE